MRPSQKFALEADIARRLADAQAILDASEKAHSERPQPNRVVSTAPPSKGSELSEAKPLTPQSVPECAIGFTPMAQANRGISPGGRHRLCADFFKPLAKLMADNTPMQKAAAKLGLRFSRRDIKRIYQLKEFVSLYRAYRRLFNSEAWGRPNEDEVLQKLILREDIKTPRPPKPRSAKYISRVRKAI
jgi:hypothetical protein